jgi:hypothetical protein
MGKGYVRDGLEVGERRARRIELGKLNLCDEFLS